MLNKAVVPLLALALITPGWIFAQEAPVDAGGERPADEPYEPFLPAAGEAPAEGPGDALVSCFDYYRFGSTPIVMSSELSTVAQGSAIGFKGTVTNENAYPLTDVDIYAKVYHRENPGVKDSFGPDVVDFFPIEERISLKAGEVRPFTLVWNVPQDADLGEYQVATFVVSHDRFNLLGLTFTVDIIGGGAKFQVVGADIGNAKIDIHQTTVGQEVLHGAAFSPRVEASEDGALPVRLRVVNTAATRAEGKLVWKLYEWDTMREERLLDTIEDPVSIESGQFQTYRYDVSDSSYSVYNVLVEYVPNDPTKQKSFQSIRFVNYDANTARLNFVGATGYPAKEGDTAFACVHSGGIAPVENAKVELEARSTSILDFLIGRGTLAKKSYEGTVLGSIQALAAPLSHGADSVVVEAKLYQDGKLADKVENRYDCSLAEGPCLDGWAKDLIALAVLVLIVLLGRYLYLKRRGSEPQ